MLEAGLSSESSSRGNLHKHAMRGMDEGAESIESGYDQGERNTGIPNEGNVHTR